MQGTQMLAKLMHAAAKAISLVLLMIITDAGMVLIKYQHDFFNFDWY